MKSLTLSLSAALLLLPMTALRAAPIEVKVDAAKTGAPINPFIYGQFIEHMGRCIYGGIWAEMLEDRKFYFPITANYSPYRTIENPDFPGELLGGDFPVVGASPWEIIGEASEVSMVREDAFVGDHSPRVNAGAGIRQRDLGVKAGLRYDGYVWAKPLGARAEIEVTLVWGAGPDDRASTKLSFKGKDFTKQTFAFTPKIGSEKGASLELRVLGGDVLLGPPSVMPSDNFKGMRRDTLALLKQLNGTVYRWPGGNFVSGYDWRDGIGDRDRRPPRKNPAWTGVEHNDFGTDEFLVFCREVGTEPMIAANTGFGDAFSAAQWVEYCNREPETVAGGWRAKNGNPKPYGVKYWCVGNEMFGPWQLGFMQMKHYTLKHNEVATAMWKMDPSLELVAVGDLTTINKDHDPDQVKLGKTCSHIMLEECAEHMNFLSEHFYVGRVPWNKNGRTDVITHAGLVREAIRAKADGHRKLQASLPNLKGKLMPVAMDEWNYWHREYAYGELGSVYELQDGLGIAAGLHEFYRQSDLIQMAHYAQTVNVIGAIKTSKTAAEMETTGLVLQLYREKFGQTPLVLSYTAEAVDIMGAITQDGKKLTLSVVNPTSEEVSVTLSATGLSLAGPAVRWSISGPSPEAHNAPGKPRVVDIARSDASASALTVPALSTTLFELPLK
jgi:alpha-N-arabinofuranosidase